MFPSDKMLSDDTHAFQLGSGATAPDPRHAGVYYLPALSRYRRIHNQHGRHHIWYYKLFTIIFIIFLGVSSFPSYEFTTQPVDV